MTAKRVKPERPVDLSDGMSILAHVRARVLGLKLIEIDADIKVAPRKTTTPVARIATDESPKQIDSGRIKEVRAGSRNGNPPGDRLAVAAEALRSGAGDLEAARRHMP